MSPRAGGSGKTALGVVGLGVLACAACCAGPLLALVGSVGAASLLASYWLPGLLVVAGAATVVLVVLLVRRRRARACRLPAGPQPVELSPLASGAGPMLTGTERARS